MIQKRIAGVIANLLVTAGASMLLSVASPWPFEWWRLAVGFYAATTLAGLTLEHAAKKAKQGRDNA